MNIMLEQLYIEIVLLRLNCGLAIMNCFTTSMITGADPGFECGEGHLRRKRGPGKFS